MARLVFPVRKSELQARQPNWLVMDMVPRCMQKYWLLVMRQYTAIRHTNTFTWEGSITVRQDGP